MKRCFYIANSYDGSYFFLSDDMNEYLKKMMAYMMNLQKSGKCNHYSFGSVEMTEKEYKDYRDKAQNFESNRIKEKESQQKDSESFVAGKNKKPQQRPNPGLRLV